MDEHSGNLNREIENIRKYQTGHRAKESNSRTEKYTRGVQQEDR